MHDDTIKAMQGEIAETRGDVKLILTNHLPHIQTSLTEHGLTLRLVLWVLAGVAGAIGAIGVALIIAALKQFLFT